MLGYRGVGENVIAFVAIGDDIIAHSRLVGDHGRQRLNAGRINLSQLLDPTQNIVEFRFQALGFFFAHRNAGKTRDAEHGFCIDGHGRAASIALPLLQARITQQALAFSVPWPMARARPIESISMAARIFLYLIAIAIVLVLLAGMAWTLFQDELLEMALVPTEAIEMLEEVEDQAYANRAMWLARPDIEDPPSDWLPEGYGDAPINVTQAEDATEDAVEETISAPVSAAIDPDQPRIPVFYVLPTTYLDRDRWNAPLNSPAARPRQELFAASQASVFNAVGEVWAPLYRQAVIGAFLTDHRNAEVALRFAYQDVESAFEYFLSEIGEDQSFILAGHSQGALHLTTLLHERIAGTSLVDRVAAAYIIGWPISVEADLPALPLPACVTAESSGCIVAFQSFAEPADPHQITRIYDESIGYTGETRRGTAMLCVNPLTGSPDGEATADANLGAIVPNEDANDASLVSGLIPARCNDQGLLLIGTPPADFGRYVLPGNNYHVFDFMLFWGNLHSDVARRVGAYRAAAR